MQQFVIVRGMIKVSINREEDEVEAKEGAEEASQRLQEELDSCKNGHRMKQKWNRKRYGQVKTAVGTSAVEAEFL